MTSHMQETNQWRHTNKGLPRIKSQYSSFRSSKLKTNRPTNDVTQFILIQKWKYSTSNMFPVKIFSFPFFNSIIHKTFLVSFFLKVVFRPDFVSLCWPHINLFDTDFKFLFHFSRIKDFRHLFRILLNFCSFFATNEKERKKKFHLLILSILAFFWVYRPIQVFFYIEDLFLIDREKKVF